ncbi:MAG: hypothetical protein GY856_27510 [bacterium]|nr:hypothetical protein [bacterium]
MLSLPAPRATAGRWLTGACQLVVDLRVRDLTLHEPALTRGPGGGMVYFRSLKKSLLQSCPYLTVLLGGLIHGLRARRERERLLLAALPIAPFVAAYTFFAWHGGLSLNLRYWTPILPSCALLTGWVWHRLSARLGGAFWWATIGALAGGLAYAGAWRIYGTGMAGRETVLLSLPLALAGGLGVLLLVCELGSVRRLAGPTLLVFAAALVWAGAVTFAYDWPRQRAHRRANLEIARNAAELVESDSLLITPFVDRFWALTEQRVRIANPVRDQFADARRLTLFHLSQGRAVYVALAPRDWRVWRAKGGLKGLVREPLWRTPGPLPPRILPARIVPSCETSGTL